MRRPIVPVLLLALGGLLAGCDQLGIESAAAITAKKESDGKAIGGACRHAGRAIEDCYTLNKKADKSAMYAGWREMSEYMRENKLETVVPVIQPEPPKAPPKPASAAGDADDEPAGHAKADAKPDSKTAAKPH